MKQINPELMRKEVNKRKDQILKWTETLIRFQSENRPPDGTESEAQNFIREECKKIGFKIDVFRPDSVDGIIKHPSWLSGRNYPKGRVDVIGEWKGSGKGRSLLLSGHVDVAPFEPDNWKVTRPYQPVVKGDRLYGRGSADMKGGLAAAFWGVKIIQELGFKLSGDVIFESLVDEEFAGGNGTLAARLKGYNTDLAVLGEPSRMEVCPACLGAFLGDIIIRGQAGMPFMGSAIPNPIYGASRAIELFQEWQNQWRAKNSNPLFQGPGKQLNVVLWCIDSKRGGEFTQMGTPLITKISWIVWCYPGMNEEEFYREFKAFWNRHMEHDSELKPFKIEIRPDYHFVRPWETDPNNPAVQEVIKTYNEYMGKTPRVGGAPLSCDLAHYGDTGRMPCVILGPRGDNLHAPDEWVSIKDIYALTGIFALLIVNWCNVIND